MWDRDFLDKWDMARRIEARLFCFGSGDSDDSSSDSGGSDPAPDDTQANYEQEAFGGSRNQTDGVNFRQAPAQPVSDSDPADRIANVVGLNTTLLDMARSAPADVRAANSARNDAIFDEFIANDMINQQIDATLNPPIQVFDMNDAAGDYMLNPSLARGNPADISVGSVNLPPAVVTDVNGQAFDTTTGELIGSDGSYFSDLGAGLERMDGPAVPTPPPPRYQTNAQRDFFENLAGQGDAAMNQFRAEVRNLNNRGFLGNRIAAGIGASGVPNFDPSRPAGSQIRGVTTTNFVDLPFVGTVPMSTYTGLDNPNAPADTSDSGDVVPPQTNPLTGAQQCPDGYIFDDFLQACRPMTRSEKGGSTGAADTGSGVFFRRTSLDDAPANLPAGFDFDAANRRFTESYGYRPDFYRSPMSLTGFTRVS